MVQQPAGTVDAFGEQNDSWTTVETVWGSLEARSPGGEGVQQERMEGTITWEVRVRYRTDVTLTAGMRISYGGRYFDIVGVADVEGRQRELVLTCKEAV